MTVSDLKLKLFRQIDSLEKDRLEELIGVVINYFNGQIDASINDLSSAYRANASNFLEF